MGIATGQDGPGGWSVSISDENGESQKITLSQGGGSSIPILVENNEIFGTITVSLDCTAPFEAQVSCPADVTVTLRREHHSIRSGERCRCSEYPSWYE